MNSELFNKLMSIGNYAILDGYCKADNVLHQSNTALCSISGGSDSDIVLDIVHRMDESNKVQYYWIDTGLEYMATKEHLNFLEEKYNIVINRIRSVKPIPICVKQYGVPFISKYVSEQMMRLQKHNFQWEDEPLEVLLKKYPRCKTALQWWCNCYYTDEGGVKKMSRFSISQNKYLKEFIMQNPPDFPISNKCCEYAKKIPAKQFIHDNYADLEITGIRRAEGGIRAANYKTCLTYSKTKSCDTYRPIFWYTDADKKVYEEYFDIQHSRCYEEYSMKRTGCAGCPYNKNISEELEIIQKYEPELYKSALNIFGKSYEYTEKYRRFAEKMKSEEKTKER